MESRPTLRDLRELLEHRREGLADFLESVHPADLAEWLADLDEEEAWAVFEAASTELQADVLEEADEPLQLLLMRNMDAAHLLELIDELPPDEAVDLLALTDARTGEEVLRSVEPELEKDLRELASYEADTAGGIMTTEFVSVPPDIQVGDAIKLVRHEAEDANEEFAGVFVVDEEGRPLGFVSDHDLLTHGIHTPIEEVMETDVVSVGVEADQEEAANLIHKYSLHNLPVVDEAGTLRGIITAEDAHDVLEEEASEDMLRLAGTSQDQLTRLPILTRVRHRLPLQAITVLGGLATAWILDQALKEGSEELSGADVLRYLPIIIGLAGNVGIQSSTILVRAFATGEVEPDREASVLGSEVVVGLIIGVLCGGVTALVAMGLESSIETRALFGCAVGAAILISVTWAAFLGCLVPMSCRRLGIDPAVAAGPFLITLSDISGAAIFVGVALYILQLGA